MPPKKSTASKTKSVAKAEPAARSAAKAPSPTAPAKSASRAKPDALELWTHEGRLAEAMRAGGFKMTPKAYAAASMDTVLYDDDGRVAIVDGTRVYSVRSKEFATLTLDGETLVVRFVAPKDRTDLDGVDRFYSAVPGRPECLEFRTPAVRDPRPSLAAKLGMMVGQASFERRRK